VYELYAPNGAAVRIVAELFGGDVIDASSGAVDRRKLGAVVIGDDAKMRALEEAVHPLVERAREEFVASRASDDVVLFDIPLLYEKGYEKTVDAVCVVSTGDEATQRERVMKRDGMTEEKFNGILARQMPDAEKRAKADYVIDTSCSLEETRARVEEILRVFTRLSGEE
jgi:dephospho-CoA kinase|tara:strand:+ start:1411 stop:1917 length:507 start_codon:yes stop_codon:yes gene_type:complete